MAFERSQALCIIDLQRVLKRCQRAGIRIHGLGSSLVAWNNDDWADVTAKEVDGRVPIETIWIDSCGAYVDSLADDPLFGRKKSYGAT